MTETWRGHSVLSVPVPALEDWVRERTAHYDAGFVSTDPAFTHAHITALAPFVDHLDEEVCRAVAEVAARIQPFAATLTWVGTFPNGIVHLLPDDPAPFRALTAALVQRFPEHPPYGGRFGTPAPHLTLDALGPGVTQRSVGASVAHLLPARVQVERLDLAWYESGACRRLASWPLG